MTIANLEDSVLQHFSPSFSSFMCFCPLFSSPSLGEIDFPINLGSAFCSHLFPILRPVVHLHSNWQHQLIYGYKCECLQSDLIVTTRPFSKTDSGGGGRAQSMEDAPSRGPAGSIRSLSFFNTMKLQLHRNSDSVLVHCMVDQYQISARCHVHQKYIKQAEGGSFLFECIHFIYQKTKQDYNKTQRESNPTVQYKWNAWNFMSILGDEAQVSPIHSAIFLSHHVILSLYHKQNISKMQGVRLQR